jgi:hypothetical protein
MTDIDPTSDLLEFLDMDVSLPPQAAPSDLAPTSILEASLPPPDPTWPEPESMVPLPLTREPPMSLVLQRLPAAQRPPLSLACATCPGAIWMSGPTTLQAFCMVTRTMSWTRVEATDIEACDGREQALLAREMEMQPGA